MRNVEIKAAVKDIEALKQKAKCLSKSKGTIIKQNDIFFKVLKGRLKLRQFEDGSGELIYYERLDIAGSKLSNYKKTSLNVQGTLGVKEVLSEANGILGMVEKIRHLYLIGHSRLHIDKVVGLGDFVELEIVLNESQSVEDGQIICKDLMEKLSITEDTLIAGAYLDLLTAEK